MKNIKKVIIIIILNILLILQTNIFAYEIEEETDYIWLQQEIENVSANPISEPNLNSRYAIVLDRNSKAVLYGKD